jgi:ubiquinone/menaquinone biosynthesis C-methylase UbiE
MSPERITPLSEEDDELLIQHKARYTFASQFVRGKNVLDIACGNGYGAELLLRGNPAHIIGMDVSPDAVEFARNHYATENVEFRLGNAEQIENIKSIDVVTSFETIEHLPHPEKFLDEIGKLLPMNGKLIISTPVRAGGTLETKPGNPFHLREWNEEEFISLLSTFFRICDPYFQFVVEKKSYPGSRTLARIGSKIFARQNYEEYMKFSVTKTMPVFPSGALKKGYIIVVCTI